MSDLSDRLSRLNINNNATKGDHFKKVKTLGSGAFGCVDLSSVVVEKPYATVGEKVAIKRFNVSDAEMAKKEAEVLKRLDDEFIVRYLDIFLNAKRQFCIVMEYCEHGTLEDYLKKFEPIPEYFFWRLIWQFSKVLTFLHGQRPPIIHNDLKPANILCKKNPDTMFVEIKIADFGVCNVLGEIPIYNEILAQYSVNFLPVAR